MATATYLMLFGGAGLSMTPVWRRRLIRFHLWTGLFTGPFLLLVGLSGAVLVLGPELDDALAGGRPSVSGEGPSASLDAIVAAARARHPGAELSALRLPEAPDRPVRVELRAGPDRLEVLVDPRAARVLRARAPERSVLVAVHSLHARLHAGRAGALAVALLGLVLVAESLTGVWLCRPWGRATFHRVLGVAFLAMTVVVALSGVLLAVAGVRALSEPADRHAPGPAAIARVGLDAAVARARAALPAARVERVSVSDADGALRVEMRRASGPGLSGPVAVLVRDGEVVVGADEEGVARAWRLVRRLHDGNFAGWLSRGLWVLTGLSVAALAVTGFLSRSASG
ncbi:MAG: PepSY-associated TM helix domain-containing protein [Candidatus Rokuibacteriota bacterium]